ncbi:MAG TPA: hypothetical protein DEW37_07895 [Oscillibacter sp.]|nr:hypothetical protein [Oscillibacter sp.]
MPINSFALKYISGRGRIYRVLWAKLSDLESLCADEKISRKNLKIVLTCAISFGTICKSAIGRILPYLRDIAMNREIAQSSEVTFGEYVRTSGG